MNDGFPKVVHQALGPVIKAKGLPAEVFQVGSSEYSTSPVRLNDDFTARFWLAQSGGQGKGRLRLGAALGHDRHPAVGSQVRHVIATRYGPLLTGLVVEDTSAAGKPAETE